MRGIIVGAGIGGLSTAIAMQMRDITVNVFEAATRLNPVGAGILVPPNAMTILDRYHLAEHVRGGGCPIESLVVLDSEGKSISKTPGHYSKTGWCITPSQSIESPAKDSIECACTGHRIHRQTMRSGELRRTRR
ncbi:MAG: NAD(P)-binding protein [Nitrospira sp.]|nr:NAD(P)-binding protein [Nitrospira sp.]